MVPLLSLTNGAVDLLTWWRLSSDSNPFTSIDESVTSLHRILPILRRSIDPLLSLTDGVLTLFNQWSPCSRSVDLLTWIDMSLCSMDPLQPLYNLRFIQWRYCDLALLGTSFDGSLTILLYLTIRSMEPLQCCFAQWMFTLRYLIGGAIAIL